MNSSKTKRDKIAPKIPIIALQVALLALLENLLDLYAPFPLWLKWLIFGVIFIFALVFSFHYFANMNEVKDGSENALKEKVKKIKENGSLESYFLAFRARPRSSFNEICVHQGKFSVSLTSSEDTAINGEHLIDQKVYWTLECSNTGKTVMTSFLFVVSLSMFTSWKDGDVTISATLNKKRESQTFSLIPSCDIFENIKDTEQVRLVRLMFPDGIQCNPAEQFIIKIKLQWNRGCYFQNTEYYFSDPINYGRRVEKLFIDVTTDIDELFSRKFHLYEIGKDSDFEQIATAEPYKRDRYERTVHWKVVPPDMNSIYVIEIEKEQKSESLSTSGLKN